MYIKNLIWKFFRYISSLRFSISLLLLLASVSILGTIIEQDQLLDYYKLNYPETKPVLYFITWKQILFFGLNHVYSTYWFFIILFVFFLSLAVCTFSTQLPIFKHARQWSFFYNVESLERKQGYNQSNYSSLINFIYVLNFNNYSIFQKGKTIYAYKGILGRIAPIFVHISIILSFIGSVFGFTNGFIAQEMVPTGEIFHIQNIIKSGSFSVISKDVLGRIDDFFITFNQDKSIQQFFSDVSILDNKGKVIFKNSISVNSPLKLSGLTFYQTDWQINALRLRIGSNNLLVKSLQKVNSVNPKSSSSWICDLKIDNIHNISILIPDLFDELFVYDNNGQLITIISYGQWTVLYGIPVVFKDLISSTGLQVKIDPGISLAYLGFFILIISIILSYVSYSEIWASKYNQKLNFSGNTNRAFVSFEDELVKIYNSYLLLSNFSK